MCFSRLERNQFKPITLRHLPISQPWPLSRSELIIIFTSGRPLLMRRPAQSIGRIITRSALVCQEPDLPPWLHCISCSKTEFRWALVQGVKSTFKANYNKHQSFSSIPNHFFQENANICSSLSSKSSGLQEMMGAYILIKPPQKYAELIVSASAWEEFKSTLWSCILKVLSLHLTWLWLMNREPCMCTRFHTDPSMHTTYWPLKSLGIVLQDSALFFKYRNLSLTDLMFMVSDVCNLSTSPRNLPI